MLFSFEQDVPKQIPLGAFTLQESQDWRVESDLLVYDGEVPALVSFHGDTTLKGTQTSEAANIRLFGRLISDQGPLVLTSLEAGATVQRDVFSNASANTMLNVSRGDRIELLAQADRTCTAEATTFQLLSNAVIAALS